MYIQLNMNFFVNTLESPGPYPNLSLPIWALVGVLAGKGISLNLQLYHHPPHHPTPQGEARAQIINVVFFHKILLLNLLYSATNIQLTHGGSFLSIMANPHKVAQYLKKESLLKLNLNLKPKITKTQC